MMDELKEKLEATYENANGDIVQVKILYVADIEELVDDIEFDGLCVVLQHNYFFEERISAYEFVKNYHFLD